MNKSCSSPGVTNPMDLPDNPNNESLLKEAVPATPSRRTHCLPNNPNGPQSLKETPYNKNKSKKHNKSLNKPLVKLNGQAYHSTMEIDPEDIRKVLAERNSSSSAQKCPVTPKPKNISVGKNLLIESHLNGTPRPKLPKNFRPADAASPTFLRLSPGKVVTSTPHGNVITNAPPPIADIKDITDEHMDNIKETLCDAAITWYHASTEWQRLRVSSLKHLQKYVEHKNEAMNSDCNTLSIEAITEAVSVGDNLRHMSILTAELASSVKDVECLGIKRELYDAVVPFSTMSLETMLSLISGARKRYRTEYLEKKEACAEMKSTCSVDEYGAACVNKLNRVLSVWGNDVHITRKDPLLRSMLKETRQL